MPDIELSSHTRDMLIERDIREEWVWRTIDSPDSKRWHVEDGNMHYTKGHQGKGRSRIARCREHECLAEPNRNRVL